MKIRIRPPASRTKDIVLVILSIVLLFPEFDSDAWNIVGPEWFWNHLQVTESFIVARMVLSRQEGIFSRGGLPGLGSLSSAYPSYVAIPAREQFQAYVEGLRFENYAPYKSQVCAQGMIFSGLDRLIPAPSRTKLRIFRGLNALLAAVVLSLIILWFFKEFGPWPAFFVLASTAASQWLVVLARGLWWSAWTFYLPMLAVMYFLRRRTAPSARRAWTLGGLLAAALFVKCLMNGYEFLTTTIIMAVVPLVYYALRDRWTGGHLLRYGLAALTASLLAVALSLGIQLAQLGALRESGQSGIRYIIWTMNKRTHGSPEDFPPIYAPSLKAGTLAVVLTYIQGPFFSSHDFRPAEFSAPTPARFQVPHAALLVLFGAFSVLLFIGRKRSSPSLRSRAGPALAATLWFSLLAPLSWLIIFKGHSYIHTHLNYVAWQIPFTLFGFALCGLSLRRMFKANKRQKW